MAYEVKPGQGSIFKNNRKEQPNHPDYSGSGKDLNGNDVWLSMWVKKDKNGNSFFSFSMQPKHAQQSQQSKPSPAQQNRQGDYIDDLPF